MSIVKFILRSIVIAAIVAIISSYVVYHITTKKDSIPAISILPLSRVAIVNNEDVALEVYYREKRLKNLYKTSFTLVNSGPIPFDASDFEDEVKITCATEVIECKEEERKPENLICNVSILEDKKTISIKLGLFNPNDYVTFGLYTEEESYDFKPLSRIKGVEEIKVGKRSELGTTSTPIEGESQFQALLTGVLAGVAAYLIFQAARLLLDRKKLMRRLMDVSMSEMDWSRVQDRIKDRDIDGNG